MALNVQPPQTYIWYVTEPTPASSPSPVPRSLDTEDADITDGNDDVTPRTPEQRKRSVRRRRKGRTENSVTALELAELRKQHLHASVDGTDMLDQPRMPTYELSRQPSREAAVQALYKYVHEPVYQRSIPLGEYENRFPLQNTAQIESDSQSRDSFIRQRESHVKWNNESQKTNGDNVRTISSNFPHSPLPNNQFPERQYPSSPFLENLYPDSGFPNTSYPVSEYPNTVLPSSTYPASGFPSAPLPGSNYPASSYPSASFPDSPFPSSRFPESSFPATPIPHYDVTDKTLC